MTRPGKATVAVWGFAAAALLAVVVSLSVAPEPGVPPDQGSGAPPPRVEPSRPVKSFKERCVQDGNAIARRISEFCKSHGWEREAVVFDDTDVKDDYSLDYKKADAVSLTVRHEMKLRFLKNTGEIVMCCDSLTFSRSTGSNSPLYDSPPPAKWTRKKAVSMASEYLRAVLDGDPAGKFKLLFARYNHPFRETPKYYTGMWHVKWARTDSHGHEFDNDFILVKMTEEDGPSLARIALPSRYDEKSVVAVEESTAIVSSRDYANRIQSRWMPSSMIKDSTSASLKIVNPNHILDRTDGSGVGERGDLDARLAWVVEYIITSERLNYDRSVNVWVDAENGSFLGGTF